MKMQDAIAGAIRRADERARQYGEIPPTPEVYAEAILAHVAELLSAEDIETILAERLRYRRALEYIANAPVSTETEIVLQGRAMIGLLSREDEAGDID